MLTSNVILSPNFCVVFKPTEFLSRVELGEISSLSRLVNENLVFPFSPDVDKETVLLNVVPVL